MKVRTLCQLLSPDLHHLVVQDVALGLAIVDDVENLLLVFLVCVLAVDEMCTSLRRSPRNRLRNCGRVDKVAEKLHLRAPLSRPTRTQTQQQHATVGI